MAELEKVGKYVYKVRKSADMNVDAIIFSDHETIDKEAVEQIVNVAGLPGIVKAAYAMPDIHWGYGFPIGGVAAFDIEDGIISPGGVGFDINCGVRLLAADIEAKNVLKRLETLDKRIYEEVPVGVGETKNLKISEKEFNRIIVEGAKKVIDMGYGYNEDLERIEDYGTIQSADFKYVSDEAYERGKDELGTLGAGNHFIEIQVVEDIYDKYVADVFGLKEGMLTVLIHTGSRGFGHQIATDYIRYMRDKLKEHNSRLKDKQLINAPFNHEFGQAYYYAMNCAANYAFANRQIITYFIRKVFKEVLKVDLKLIYDVAHNIAKVETYEINDKKRKVIVHRKGATRSLGPGNKLLPESLREVGQPVLIPGSMGTASYVLVGTEKAEQETFGSTAHGAGRVLGRRQATRNLSVSGVLKELDERGVKLLAKSKKGIVEEAPEAYKDVDRVVNIVDEIGISKKVAKCRPIAVIKG